VEKDFGNPRKSPRPSFEDLEVFQKAYKVSLEIHKVTLKLPVHEQYGLAENTRRLSKNLCSAIAESSSKQKYSSVEYRRLLNLGISLCDEMRVWLRYSLDLGYIELSQWQEWRSTYQEIARILIGLERNTKDYKSYLHSNSN
jgi:four helix bundle protein